MPYPYRLKVSNLHTVLPRQSARGALLASLVFRRGAIPTSWTRRELRFQQPFFRCADR